MKKFWYCDNCTEEIHPNDISFNEVHIRCGYPVRWVEILEDEDIKEE